MELPTPEDLRNRRLELDMTQSDLAERAEVSQPLIARIEGGDVDPRLSTLRRIVNALEHAEDRVVRAEDLMHEAVISVAPDDTVHKAVERMQEAGYSQLPVIQDGVPVGSMSDADVVHAREEEENVGELPVREIMAESFPTVSGSATLDEISSLLDHYKAVMVTKSGETVGIITEADVAAFIS